MSGFSSEWLGLREAADHAARSVALSRFVASRVSDVASPVSARHPLRVLDLATGTGSNPRYLAQYLAPWQDWTLLDADPRLLAQLPTSMAAWATRSGWACVHNADGVVLTTSTGTVRTSPHLADISTFPIAAFADRPALVTASALLDLVSDQWVASLVSACRETGAAALFALSYDGQVAIVPGHSHDELVLSLVNRHQTGDKGFGPALGPQAASVAASHFRDAGYEVQRERSDWSIGSLQRQVQSELVAGWVDAASQVAPETAQLIQEWGRERQAQAAAGGLSLVVGHEDLAAWPAGRLSDHA